MLQRQTSGSSVIAENLKNFQMQLEKSDNEDKKRLQVRLIIFFVALDCSSLDGSSLTSPCSQYVHTVNV